MDDPLFRLFDVDDPEDDLSVHLHGSKALPRLTLQEDLIARATAAKGSTILSLKGGLPNKWLFPDPIEVFAAASADVASGLIGRDAFQYAFAEGLENSRAWVVEQMRKRGVKVSPDRVVILSGAHEGLSLLLRMYPRGTRVAFVGDKTYPMAIKLARKAGHILVRPGEKADLYYVMPGAANPDGRDYLEGRREELIASGADIIVDETFAYLRFDGVVPHPLFVDAPGRVFLVSSISKWIAPGYRFGWVITPEHRRAELVEQKELANLNTAPVLQEIFTSWARREGNCEKILIAAREYYRAHAERLVALLRYYLPDWDVIVPDGGLTLWVETDLYGSEVAFLRHAVLQGVAIDAGSRFVPFPSESGKIMLRLGFSSLSFDELEEAVKRLVKAVKSIRRYRS
jgi:2-aminoadipate transaminase